MPETQADAADCSVAGSYRGDLDPPALVVSASASTRRRYFTALHELGHHLQQTDEELGEAVLAVEASQEFEDAACDAFAGRILLPDDLVNTHIGPRGPTATEVAELYRRSQASRAACCVRAAQRLRAPGVIVVYNSTGIVSFAAGRGDIYPPARSTDQSTTPLLQRALHMQDREAAVTKQNTTILYRDGSRYDSLYGQATWCDGYVVAVLTTDTVPWQTFAPPSPQGRSSTEKYWECETCQDTFTPQSTCATCGQPQCPAGHCGCTLQGERVCTQCWMSRHRQQFPDGNSAVCRMCLE
ncbi:hypothetical protein F4561_005192 [Lipingzhangella halophila]|uniref:IrrE N-terminal-like domain-containing protein n=1 Tax=Lipingzhangella halophila TaxID=1783352 RepID=A0A7W7RM94_9ACTN|nr:ImmA/IrrE family metallo-endopeptidase [Lipingzhangella halophila]MBB4934372.1 hypothetical protein [Lipingzhangella halophila]